MRAPYLLLTFIPYYVDSVGDIWLDRLWHHDFVEHLTYLRNLILAAPRQAKPAAFDAPDLDLVRLEVPDGARLAFRPLPPLESTFDAVRGLPATIKALWQAIGEADVVHSGVAGWPYPIGWVGNPIAMLRRKRLMLVVESAPWRLTGATGEEGLKKKLRAEVTERMARWFVNRADLVLCTQPGYRDSLFTHGKGRVFITPAVWINEENILTDEAMRLAWNVRRTEPVRFFFGGRLTAQKGVDVLLEALRSLDARGMNAPDAEHPVHVDIVGVGDARAQCERAASALRFVKLRVLDPVAYGKPFFDLLSTYHAVLVPSLADEQPRIVFDAFARALPVIASDTHGLSAHVEDGKTGWIVPRADALALAGALRRASDDVATLERMGKNALEVARASTHRGMHQRRLDILFDTFGSLLG